MAITLVGTPQSTSALNGGDITLTFDVALATSDVILVFGGPSSVTPPSIITTGYTKYVASSDVRSTTAPKVGIFYKVAGTTPDTTVACEGGGNANDGVAYLSYVLRGVDTSVIFDSTYGFVHSTVDPSSDYPPVTVVTSGSWVLPLGMAVSNAVTTGFSSGYTNTVGVAANDTFDVSLAASTREVSAGVENPNLGSTGVPWSVAAQQGSFTIAIRPASASTSTGTVTLPTPSFMLLGVGSV